MVVGYRNMDDKNGRRSRGQSPNGHLSDDSSGSDDSEHDNGMRVGDDYQVLVPLFNPGARSDARAEAMLVWAPHPELSDTKLDEYLHVAKEKHSYNVEQSLGMLFWHKHNVDKALADLPNFTPFPDEWTVEDKVLFEQAFSFHGKSFHRIRQMLPDKSIASLVKYYYSWKKTRSRTSLMDRQARKLTNQRDESDEDADDSGNSESDIDSTNGQQTQPQAQSKEETKLLSSGKPCPASKKPEGSLSSAMRMKNKRKPPRGMYLNHEDMIALATGPPGQGEAILKQLDTELVTLKRQVSVQNNKQLLSMHKQKAAVVVDELRPPENLPKINPRWSNEELLLAVQGVRKYGKDFKAIAEVIGNKTEAHIRSFFVNYRRRYNLDEVMGEYEKEHGGQDGSREGDAAVEEMEVDMQGEDSCSSGPIVNGDVSTTAAAVKADNECGDQKDIPPAGSSQPGSKPPATSPSPSPNPTPPPSHQPPVSVPQTVV